MKNKQAFTLIELMVATTVFVMVIGFGLSMYLSINTIQRKTIKANEIYSEARYWLDRLVEEIQTYDVYYDSSLPYPAAAPEDELHLTDEYGERVRYFLADRDGDTRPDTLKRQIGDGAEDVLSSPAVSFNNLAVYIDPLVESEVDSPKVTILLEVSGKGITDDVVMNLQTTTSVRNY